MLTPAEIQAHIDELHGHLREIEMQANIQLARTQGQIDTWTFLLKKTIEEAMPPAAPAEVPSPAAGVPSEEDLTFPGDQTEGWPAAPSAGDDHPCDDPASEGGGEEAPYA